MFTIYLLRNKITPNKQFSKYFQEFDLIKVIVSDEISRYNPINKNLFKPPVEEKIKDFVRKNFTKEIEFYEFCKQRLHKQYLALKLPQK